MKEYDSFTECYYDLIDEVYNHHDFECAPRNQKIYENLCMSFKIKDPRNRLLYVPGRKFSLHYTIAEGLWYFLGNNKTEWISNYASFWSHISDDGETANSAYGARIFKPHERIADGTFAQWDYIKEELKRDPDSRRAVIHIRTPEDSVKAKLDVPCTLSMQFFIREEKLDLVVNMRSTDLVYGLSYDVPAFTMMQELMALELGIELGSYMHVSNSLHVYEKHFKMCEDIQRLKMINMQYPTMPRMTSEPPSERLDKIQADARQCASWDDLAPLINGVEGMDMDDYWKDWAYILLSHRAKKLKLDILADSIISMCSNDCFRECYAQSTGDR